jgi:hypothetical protein
VNRVISYVVILMLCGGTLSCGDVQEEVEYVGPRGDPVTLSPEDAAHFLWVVNRPPDSSTRSGDLPGPPIGYFMVCRDGERIRFSFFGSYAIRMRWDTNEMWKDSGDVLAGFYQRLREADFRAGALGSPSGPSVKGKNK